MSSQQPTQKTGDKKQQALTELCQLIKDHPEKKAPNTLATGRNQIRSNP